MTDALVALVRSRIPRDKEELLIARLAHLLSLLPPGWASTEFTVAFGYTMISARWPAKKVVISVYESGRYSVLRIRAHQWPSFDGPGEVAEYIRGLPAQ